MDTDNTINTLINTDRHIQAFRFAQRFSRGTGTVLIFKHPTGYFMLFFVKQIVNDTLRFHRKKSTLGQFVSLYRIHHNRPAK